MTTFHDKIEQVDVELCEDARTVMFYGYLEDDVVALAAITLPCAIEAEAFIPSEWREVDRRRLEWWVPA